MEKYPGFENLPANYIGFEDKDAGVVFARKSLRAVQGLAEQFGAHLMYGTEVVEVSKYSVKLSDG